MPQEKHHILSVLVENRAGVLTRVAGLFARRGFNIHSLAVAPTDDPARSRISIVVDVASTPLEQAYPLLFLCSDAAAAISGITLVTDAGYLSSGTTESFPPATPVAQFLTGKLT